MRKRADRDIRTDAQELGDFAASESAVRRSNVIWYYALPLAANVSNGGSSG